MALATLVLARPSDDPLMAAITGAIERAEIPIVLVDLDPRVTDDAAHEQRVRAALARVPGPAILAGFSLGARIAARLCPELEPRALLGLGYPFHVAKQPSTRHGLEALSRVRVPTRIIQGTRDAHGSEAQVRGYALPDAVEIVWLRDGNHRFVPRARSGLTHDAHIAAAARAAIFFIQSQSR